MRVISNTHFFLVSTLTFLVIYNNVKADRKYNLIYIRRNVLFELKNIYIKLILYNKNIQAYSLTVMNYFFYTYS